MMKLSRQILRLNFQRCLSDKNTRNTLPPDFKSSEKLLENAVVHDDKLTNEGQDAWITPTYHEIDEGTQLLNRPKRVKNKKYKPKMPVLDEDHSENSVILFPGQGCQYVGMGQKVIDKAPSTKDLFHRASTILGYDLLNLCLKVIKINSQNNKLN